MGRKKRKAKTAADAAAAIETRRRIVRGLLTGVGAAVALAAVAVGVQVLRGHVERTVAFPAEPPAVVLKDRPAWMSDLLAEQIAAMARPAVARSALDHQMLVEAVELLRSSPWVREVRQVRRVYGEGPGDRLEIDCDFRAPVALVQWGDYLWLVDGEAVKLPEQYTLEQAPLIIHGGDGRTNIRIIEGVRRPPPESGQTWAGEDLAAGLELVKLLDGRPYAEEVLKVDVSNFQGRNSPREAQIVLVTKHNTEVRWGRPVNAKDFFIEVSTAQKLDYMRQVHEEFGRVDGTWPWIDIRFDRITHPVRPGGAQSREGIGSLNH